MLIRSKKYYLLFIGIFICSLSLYAQNLSFQHLDNKDGMYSNYTSYACFDSTGFIWLAGNDGLLSYDGVTVQQYLKETYPALPRNELGYIFCDSKNQIWVCTKNGLAMVNVERRIERIIIADSLKNADIDFCAEIKGKGIIATTKQHTYLFDFKKNHWSAIDWFDKKIRRGAEVSELIPYNEHSCIFIFNDRLVIADFLKEEILNDIAIENVTAACKINNNNLIAVCNNGWGVYKINLATNSITKNYNNVKDEYGYTMANSSVYCCTATDGNVYITTQTGGLIQFNPVTEKFFSIQHDPLNNHSISTNSTRRVSADNKGYLVVTSSIGINFTNLKYNMFRQQNYFKDKEGNIFDGTVVGIAEDENKKLWISNYFGLFIYDTASNFVKTVYKIDRAKAKNKIFADAGRMAKDKFGNMWTSPNGEDIHVYTSNTTLLKKIILKSNSSSAGAVRIIKMVNDTLAGVGTERSMQFINIKTFKKDTLPNHPKLKIVFNKRIVDIMSDGNKLWIATSPNGSAFCYDFLKKDLKVFDVSNGLSSNRVYCFAKDFFGNVYIGTYDGLNIIDSTGKIKIINKTNGLRHPRIENIVTDKNGYLWISNFNSLLRFNPASNYFNYFDERNGVSNAGFSVVSNAITKSGMLYLGDGTGMLEVNTERKLTQQPKSSIIIQHILNGAGYKALNKNDTIQLSYKDASLNLYYLTQSLISGNRYLYRYKLVGSDTGWSAPTKNHQVTYKLQPGKYTFKVQAAYTENLWEENENSITIIVKPPFWQTILFKILSVFLIGLLVYVVYKRRIRSVKIKSAVNQQMAELEGKALRAQMNPHFIFNCLNAIQELIVTKNYKESYLYLSKFSKLLRMVLNNSEKNLIPLQSEIEMNQLYLELESLRFKKSFHYQIDIDNSIDVETVLFPSLLIQPFIENAIWHGLMHKSGEKILDISFKLTEEKINCTINDNGIGRIKSAEIKAQKLGAFHFDSKGTILAQQRIETLTQLGFKDAAIKITDNYDTENIATGTTVEIIIPLQKN